MKTPYPLSTCYHEAGHALAAISEGIGIELIKVAPRGSYIMSPFEEPVRGYCWYSTAPVGVSHAITSLAGPFAKMKYQRRRVTTGAEMDIDIFEAELIKASAERGDCVENLRALWFALTQDLIDEQWKRISAIAQVLAHKGHMHGNHRLLKPA